MAHTAPGDSTTAWAAMTTAGTGRPPVPAVANDSRASPDPGRIRAETSQPQALPKPRGSVDSKRGRAGFGGGCIGPCHSRTKPRGADRATTRVA